MQQKPLANRGAIGAQCDFWLRASMSIQYQIWRKTTTKPMHRKFSGWTVIIEGSRTNCLIFNLRDKSDISPVGLTGTAELMSDEEQEKGCMCTFWHPGVFLLELMPVWCSIWFIRICLDQKEWSSQARRSDGDKTSRTCPCTSCGGVNMCLAEQYL